MVYFELKTAFSTIGKKIIFLPIKPVRLDMLCRKLPLIRNDVCRQSYLLIQQNDQTEE